jgi:hypothetical protein
VRFFFSFWKQFVEHIAMQIPVQSAQQDRLVELMRELFALDKDLIPVRNFCSLLRFAEATRHLPSFFRRTDALSLAAGRTLL